MHTVVIAVEKPFLVGVPSEAVGIVIFCILLSLLLATLAFGKGRPHH